MITDTLLIITVTLVLFLPLLVHRVEKNLEAFMCIMGIIAITISRAWSIHILEEALMAPLKISAAVFVVALIFQKYHYHIHNWIHAIVEKMGLRFTLFAVLVVLGITSSLITAIIAGLALGEIATVLCLERKARVKLCIYTCFAISMGAVLTPIGEPLGTIVISKLKVDSMFMLKLLWPYILPGILFLGFLASRLEAAECEVRVATKEAFHGFKDIVIRVVKVYIFVVGLVLLGEGLKDLAMQYIAHLNPHYLYWANIMGAVLDNATVAAIEVVPGMDIKTLEYLLISLVLGGGLLIPGNIPNIIVASKVNIKNTEWARYGVPMGLFLMLVYFLALYFIVH